MDATTIILEILKITLPVAVVLVTVYILNNSNNEKEERKERYEIRMQAINKIVPLRLQAYERAILFLERISPENILMRISANGMDANTYLRMIQNEIRAEYEHNMAQQLYVSVSGWMELKKAKDQIISLANQSASELPDRSTGYDLGKRMMEKMIENDYSPSGNAIELLKMDIQKAFRLIP